jgi:hypothetical protein
LITIEHEGGGSAESTYNEFTPYHHNTKINSMAACLRIKQLIKKSYWKAQRDIISQVYHNGYNTKRVMIAAPKTNVKLSDMIKHDELFFTKVFKKDQGNKTDFVRKVLPLVGQSIQESDMSGMEDQNTYE